MTKQHQNELIIYKDTMQLANILTLFMCTLGGNGIITNEEGIN